MLKILLIFLGALIAFLDYCILRFNGEMDREINDQLQEEFIKEVYHTKK